MFVKVQLNFNFDCSFQHLTPALSPDLNRDRYGEGRKRDKFNAFPYMISKNQVKLIRSLNVKKFREREALFIAEGEKIVNELFDSSFRIHSVYFTPEWKDGIREHRDLKKLHEISEPDLKKISLLENPNKVLAIVHIPEMEINLKKIKEGFTLMLDDIQDPGNLGTIIRTADWFGIKNIICSKNTVDAFNPKVVQSSMGSLFRINFFYDDLRNVLTQIKNECQIPVYGALLTGENILNKKLNPQSVLLIGNESKGISGNLSNFIDEGITIPKPGSSAAESLNAAVAASILCYEFCRQLQDRKK
jgi:RNA methyltransferase, TrmH family